MSLNGKFGVINGQIILLMVTPGRWSCTYERWSHMDMFDCRSTI